MGLGVLEKAFFFERESVRLHASADFVVEFERRVHVPNRYLRRRTPRGLEKEGSGFEYEVLDESDIRDDLRDFTVFDAGFGIGEEGSGPVNQRVFVEFVGFFGILHVSDRVGNERKYGEYGSGEGIGEKARDREDRENHDERISKEDETRLMGLERTVRKRDSGILAFEIGHRGRGRGFRHEDEFGRTSLATGFSS